MNPSPAASSVLAISDSARAIRSEIRNSNYYDSNVEHLVYLCSFLFIVFGENGYLCIETLAQFLLLWRRYKIAAYFLGLAKLLPLH